MVWDDDHHLVIGARGGLALLPELRGLIAHFMHGLQRATPGTAVAYVDQGVSYSVDPGLWTVESAPTPSGQTSRATLRNTTLRTEWAPLTEGLLGPPPGIAEALRERVESATLGWTFEGEVGEPVYGEAAFGADASVPAHFAVLRRADADGRQWDETWMVGDVNDRRCWTLVTNEVADTAAVESVRAVLATVLPR